MWANLKEKLFSESGMKLINAFFIIAYILGKGPLVAAAFILWLLYLIYAIRKTNSRFVQTVYILLCLFAVWVIAQYVIDLLS